MNRLICRVIGHRWGWPTIPVIVAPHGYHICRPTRQCTRCQHQERDLYMQTDFQIYTDDPYRDLGNAVTRAMGWEKT